ncbi:MAG: four helix bundle protein [Dehalococcoidia bacterium]
MRPTLREGSVRPFQDLIVWQKAHRVTLEVYRLTTTFPKSELYGLTSQMRRSAASIPTNIAEGSVYDDNLQFQRFLGIALGSAAELEYQLILVTDLGYVDRETSATLDGTLAEVKKMLVALRKRERSAQSTKS